MSVLEVPRILFSGEVTWDPIVTNNYQTFYDENTGEAILPNAADQVKAFRQAAIASVTKGNWNPHGTHRVVFYDSAISAVDLGSNVVTNDPFVGAAVHFHGMLVDLEPFGGITSQLFFNRMNFGVDGGYRILARRSARVTARYINFGRNPANNMIAGIGSAAWQTSFAKLDGLRVDAFDSPALQALAAALQASDVLGVTVNFNVYRTIYFDNPALSNRSTQAQQAEADLQTKLTAGGFQPNPARSRLVGVIGLWRKGEPPHEPGDRALLPVGNSPLGAAHARLAENSLTLDLSNCIPEESRDLVKKDFGPLTVVAIDTATSSPTILGTLNYAQYNREAYDASSGIVTMPLTQALAQFAADKDIQVKDETGTALLGEQSLRAIPATPNLYLSEGDSAVAEFQVYDRGRPATSTVPVTLFTMSADGGTVENTESLTTDGQGVLSVPVANAAPGIVAFVPAPMGTNPPTGGIDPQSNTYMYVRTLPADASTAALPPTWDNVYAKVLANWNAMAPCMDNWLKFDDPTQVKAQAAIIKRLTDPAHFEDFRFMPVTRDMTAGERTLLYRFLDTPVGADEALRAAAAPEVSRFAALSRSHRRG